MPSPKQKPSQPKPPTAAAVAEFVREFIPANQGPKSRYDADDVADMLGMCLDHDDPEEMAAFLAATGLQEYGNPRETVRALLADFGMVWHRQRLTNQLEAMGGELEPGVEAQLDAYDRHRAGPVGGCTADGCSGPARHWALVGTGWLTPFREEDRGVCQAHYEALPAVQRKREEERRVAKAADGLCVLDGCEAPVSPEWTRAGDYVHMCHPHLSEARARWGKRTA